MSEMPSSTVYVEFTFLTINTCSLLKPRDKRNGPACKKFCMPTVTGLQFHSYSLWASDMCTKENASSRKFYFVHFHLSVMFKNWHLLDCLCLFVSTAHKLHNVSRSKKFSYSPPFHVCRHLRPVESTRSTKNETLQENDYYSTKPDCTAMRLFLRGS